MPQTARVTTPRFNKKRSLHATRSNEHGQTHHLLLSLPHLFGIEVHGLVEDRPGGRALCDEPLAPGAEHVALTTVFVLVFGIWK
jgi:hypothetical protein